jgi:3D (Asp-Asp-Asp) domain-containing protein
MQSTRYHSRRRRSLSLGEVGVFVLLVLGMSLLAMHKPGTAATEGTGEAGGLASANAVGLSLMNVKTANPSTMINREAASVMVRPESEQVVVVGDVLTPTDTSDERPMFDGRPLRRVRQVTMLTTAYSPDAKSCGKWADGFTASGYSVWTNGMKLVAADTKILSFGTLVSIPGYNGGRPVPVLDRGGKIKGNHLDLLYPTHEIAMQWGVQHLAVDIWEYAD